MLETALIPAKAGGTPRLLVVLHGLGDSMEGYRWLPEMLQLPWLNYLLVNAPDPYFGGYSWYDFAGDPLPGIQRSRTLLSELVDKLPEIGFQQGQTAFFGFSQGCLMTLETGLRYPRPLAGLVGISGYLHDPAALIREKSPAALEEPILITHGKRDPLIPVDMARRQIILMKEAGFQIEWHELDKPHTIAGEDELELIRRFLERVFNSPASNPGDPAIRKSN
jgi:phospholipase/carboxylesterase